MAPIWYTDASLSLRAKPPSAMTELQREVRSLPWPSGTHLQMGP